MTSMSESEQAVEALIDKYGLTEVLNATQAVCVLKGEHIRENWQDEALAKVWDKAARKVCGAWTVIQGLGIFR